LVCVCGISVVGIGVFGVVSVCVSGVFSIVAFCVVSVVRVGWLVYFVLLIRCSVDLCV